MLRPVQADSREPPVDPATINEFKQIEFSDLTGRGACGEHPGAPAPLIPDSSHAYDETHRPTPCRASRKSAVCASPPSFATASNQSTPDDASITVFHIGILDIDATNTLAT